MSAPTVTGRILHDATPEKKLSARLDAAWAAKFRSHLATGTPADKLVLFGIEGSLTRDGELADLAHMGGGRPGEAIAIVLNVEDAMAFLARLDAIPKREALIELVWCKPKPLAIVLKVVDGQVVADWRPYSCRGNS